MKLFERAKNALPWKNDEAGLIEKQKRSAERAVAIADQIQGILAGKPKSRREQLAQKLQTILEELQDFGMRVNVLESVVLGNDGPKGTSVYVNRTGEKNLRPDDLALVSLGRTIRRGTSEDLYREEIEGKIAQSYRIGTPKNAFILAQLEQILKFTERLEGALRELQQEAKGIRDVASGIPAPAVAGPKKGALVHDA